jgi:hypothetical protein
MKLAGGGDLSEIDVAAFLEQAAEYDRAGDLRDSMIKIGMVLDRSHPLPVARAAALRAWIDAGDYQRILAGDYPRRDDPRGSVRDDVRAAANSYRESFARSQDPLVSLLRRLGDGAGEWVGAGAGRVRDFMAGAARSAGGGQSSTNGTGAANGTGSGAPDGDNWSAATRTDPDEPPQPGDER